MKMNNFNAKVLSVFLILAIALLPQKTSAAISSLVGLPGFGGFVVNVIMCTCSTYSLINVIPASPLLPSSLMYDPSQAITFAYFNPAIPGVNILGTHTTDVPCLVLMPIGGKMICIPVGVGKNVFQVGSSL